VRSLKLLNLQISHQRPPSFFLLCLLLCRATAPPQALVPCRARLFPAPAPLHASPPSSPTALAPPAGLPRARHAAARATSSWLPSPPQLTAAAALPVPPPALAALTRCLQASRRSSSSLLACSYALHVALSLPELCPLATSPPSRLAPMRASPPFFAGLRLSVASPPSISLSLALAFHTELRIHRRRSSSSPATSLLTVGKPPQLLPIHDSPSSSFAMIP
jgi:hypothetical protein